MKTLTEQEMDDYEKTLIEREKSNATIEKYLRDLRAFSFWLDGKEVEKELVASYKAEIAKKYTATTVNSIISSLNSFFDHRKWSDCKVKALRVQRNAFAAEEKTLTKEDYHKLLDEAQREHKERLLFLLQTVCSTGIRISELCFITRESLDKGQVSFMSKGKVRKVFLPKTLCQSLASFAERENIKKGPLFVTKGGRPLNRSNVWRDLKSLSRRARISESKVFPHNLRHLFARTYYSVQKDIVRLADILGHSNVNTTRIYTIESGEEHRRQIEELGLLQK